MGLRFPYVVYVPMQNLRNVYRSRAWCEKQFGKQIDVDNLTGSWTYVWAGVERMREYEYRFAREQDAVLFSLKWLR
jgi:hypothetical protein